MSALLNDHAVQNREFKVFLSYYRPQTKFAKVMFSQMFVCQRGAGVDGEGGYSGCAWRRGEEACVLAFINFSANRFISASMNCALRGATIILHEHDLPTI